MPSNNLKLDILGELKLETKLKL